MKIKCPIVKLVMFHKTPTQFRFLNIHIKHKAQLVIINMLLKGAPHRHLYICMQFWT
jgi:hypothetical protein